MQDIWRSENKYVVEITYRIEMLNYDLRKVQFEIQKMVYKIAEIEIKMKLIKKSLHFLKTQALIVSMIEYRKLETKLSNFEDALVYASGIKNLNEARTETIKGDIKFLQKKLESSTFKLLEFPSGQKAKS